MGIKLDNYGGVGVIAPEGELTEADAAPAAKALADWAGAGTDGVVFDLTKTTFIDSRGLEILTAAARRPPPGGKVVLAGVGEHCRKILEMTRLDSRFESYPDAATALKALGRRR